MNYEVDIPLKPLYIRMIAEAIPNAYYLYDEHVNEQNFLTDNGRDGEIWNYINKCASEVLPVDSFQIVVMNRGIWKFLGLYDKETHYLYTLMREKNLINIQKKISDHLFHYLNALSKLNDELAETYEPIYHQMSLFGVDSYDEEGNEVLEKILKTMIRKIDGDIERYVLIAFDSDRFGVVKNIRGIIPSKGLDFYKDENWNTYIATEYEISEEAGQESEVLENIVLLQRKPRMKRVEKTKRTTKKINE